MKFPQTIYTEILKSMITRFHWSTDKVTSKQWLIFRRRLKELLTKGFQKEEIIRAIPIAGERKKWGDGKSFWKRIEYAIEEMRYTNQRKSNREDGMKSLKDIFKL